MLSLERGKLRTLSSTHSPQKARNWQQQGPLELEAEVRVTSKRGGVMKAVVESSRQTSAGCSSTQEPAALPAQGMLEGIASRGKLGDPRQD